MTAEQKIPIFSRVRCRAYLKAVKDGVHLIAYDEDGAFCYETHKPFARVIAYQRKPDEIEEKEIKDLSAFEGDGVVKTYRERTEADFSGVVVGYKRVAVKGIIGTDYFDNGFSEHAYCFKNITESPLAAVVYFKNNCKRYVLPEDMEVSEDG
jgi:hypothetical protein